LENPVGTPLNPGAGLTITKKAAVVITTVLVTGGGGGATVKRYE